MDPRGPRSELVSRLMQCGVYTINTDIEPMPKFADVSTKFPNHSSVLLGNGAQINNQKDEKLVICNKPSNSTDPLVLGDFKQKTVEISDCLKLKETPNFNSDIPGAQGDIRRSGDTIYMYRCSSVHPGWYPLQFGTMMLF